MSYNRSHLVRKIDFSPLRILEPRSSKATDLDKSSPNTKIGQSPLQPLNTQPLPTYGDESQRQPEVEDHPEWDGCIWGSSTVEAAEHAAACSYYPDIQRYFGEDELGLKILTRAFNRLPNFTSLEFGSHFRRLGTAEICYPFPTQGSPAVSMDYLQKTLPLLMHALKSSTTCLTVLNIGYMGPLVYYPDVNHPGRFSQALRSLGNEDLDISAIAGDFDAVEDHHLQTVMCWLYRIHRYQVSVSVRGYERSVRDLIKSCGDLQELCIEGICDVGNFTRRLDVYKLFRSFRFTPLRRLELRFVLSSPLKLARLLNHYADTLEEVRLNDIMLAPVLEGWPQFLEGLRSAKYKCLKSLVLIPEENGHAFQLKPYIKDPTKEDPFRREVYPTIGASTDAGFEA
ncbi:MAG: hypothetical protein Q9163_005798 [Psora crenata]